jgi:hypothetical protein
MLKLKTSLLMKSHSFRSRVPQPRASLMTSRKVQRPTGPLSPNDICHALSQRNLDAAYRSIGFDLDRDKDCCTRGQTGLG